MAKGWVPNLWWGVAKLEGIVAKLVSGGMDG
jgi:hypothetical protein